MHYHSSDLERWYTKGIDYLDWYDNTQRAIRVFYGDDTDRLIAFLAATSPRNPLKQNVEFALRALAAYRDIPFPECFDGFMRGHRHNLIRAVKGEPLHGMKVGPFHRALTGDTEAVVIDTWMADALGLAKWLTPKRVKAAQSVITAFAKVHNVEPRQAQAAIWCGIKREVEGEGSIVEPFEKLLVAAPTT